MKHKKKSVEITGTLLAPLEVGNVALISEKQGIRRTSIVLRIITSSLDWIRFETQNTIYMLRIHGGRD